MVYTRRIMLKAPLFQVLEIEPAIRRERVTYKGTWESSGAARSQLLERPRRIPKID